MKDSIDSGAGATTLEPEETDKVAEEVDPQREKEEWSRLT